MICHIVQIGRTAVIGCQQVQRGPLWRERIDGDHQRLGRQADVAREVFHHDQDGVVPIGQRLDGHFPRAQSVAGIDVGPVGTHKPLAHKLRGAGEKVGGEDTDHGIRLGQTPERRLIDSGHVIRTGPHRAEEPKDIVEGVAGLQQVDGRDSRSRAIDNQREHLGLDAAVARCVERLGAEEVRTVGQREIADR